MEDKFLLLKRPVIVCSDLLKYFCSATREANFGMERVVARVATSFTFASLAEVFAAAGPIVRSGSVLESLGNGRRTQQRPRTASQNRRSGVGETRHLQRSARAYHALRPHCTQHLHPRTARYTKGGRHNVAYSPKDIYYIQ